MKAFFSRSASTSASFRSISARAMFTVSVTSAKVASVEPSGSGENA